MTSTALHSWFGPYQPYESGHSPERVAEMLGEAMRISPGGQFPLAAEPVVVPRESYRSLLDATARLLELHRVAVANLAPDTAGRMTALKADPALFPRFTADEAFELGHATDVARADVMIGADGPRFLEFNVGASVGCMAQFERLRRAWRDLASEAGKPVLTGTDLYAPLAEVLKRSCKELGVGPEVLLIDTSDDLQTTSAYVDAQLGLLREHGVHARFTELRDLGRVEDLGNVLGVVQFSEGEAARFGWDISPLASAMGAGLTAVPSQTARLLDTKKVLALLSEGLPWMTGDDRDLVRRFVPWSRVTGDRQVTWRGQAHDLPRLLLNRPELFVLKLAAGLYSDDVYFGATATDREWRQLVATATETEDYIAQELVEPLRPPMAVLLDESGRTETVRAKMVVSPFCVGGVATGCYVRFNTAATPGILSVHDGLMRGCLLGEPS
ncbi:hypothetical protein SAMN05421504_101752 [Amycolatopsis xylanica]|uniref:Circularly permuted type 2 ATP-grasp protein n=1 Tax=Amycolatopsis xylanica TaxID=589385 RepID=A0A1H2U0V6_9PSEU|nr:hypothetical protein [Amycolatopsis xylanica]SDW49852.1 hypothetical protein SAMN05421504_101752 [Amycolatopsis xylanica]